MQDESELKFVVNPDKVLMNKTLPSWIHKAAFQLQGTGYLGTGEFFEMLDDEELFNMRDYAESIKSHDYNESFPLLDGKFDKELEYFALLCFLLALGEGEISLTPYELSHELIPSLFILIGIESLHRQGKATVYRDSYSLFKENGNGKVVQIGNKKK